MNVGLTELCRAEYETDPDITIDEICDKYNIDRMALGPTNEWQKVMDIPTPIEPIDLAPTSPVVPIQLVPKDAPAPQVSNNKDMIDNFKSITLGEALARIRDEGSDMSVKDMKELVALVDTIERSYNKHTDANQINIIVQNVINKYIDDC